MTTVLDPGMHRSEVHGSKDTTSDGLLISWVYAYPELMRTTINWCGGCAGHTEHVAEPTPWPAYQWLMLWPIVWAFHRWFDPPVCLACLKRGTT